MKHYDVKIFTADVPHENAKVVRIIAENSQEAEIAVRKNLTKKEERFYEFLEADEVIEAVETVETVEAVETKTVWRRNTMKKIVGKEYLAYEETNDFERAIEKYTRIRNEYPSIDVVFLREDCGGIYFSFERDQNQYEIDEERKEAMALKNRRLRGMKEEIQKWGLSNEEVISLLDKK